MTRKRFAIAAICERWEAASKYRWLFKRVRGGSISMRGY